MTDPIKHFMSQFIPAIEKSPLVRVPLKTRRNRRCKPDNQIEVFGAKIHKLKLQKRKMREIREILGISGVSSVYTRYKRKYLNQRKKTERDLRQVKRTYH